MDSPLLQTYISQLQGQLLDDLCTSVPALTELYQYYVRLQSKRLRPRLILLMAQATNGLGSAWSKKQCLPGPLQVEENDCSLNQSGLANVILPEQLRLAEVIEMIHVATLMHDDVIDESPLRRGAPSAPAQFGNKQSILGGDALLARALMLSASLGVPEVVTNVASVLSTLVEGELLQAQDTMTPVKQTSDDESRKPGSSDWDSYLKKTYMKTASLFSRALSCTVILGGATESDPLRDIASEFGSQLGMAFQIVDDILDFEGGEAMGKPVTADLHLGLATAPVLFALEENDEMQQLVDRRFQEPGDVQRATMIVKSTNALPRAGAVARAYAQKAHDALAPLPASPAKVALQCLAMGVIARDH
ncbi:terpenoid synthase [Hygrophoropsis aurantiaca]|uniref:Terpenoid synthase n=1 Tax=Hygrophoropsis aurantiaca TaxID=72124 RepID=A0ACB8A0L6_9AGAM|nr:terpenoid synthase [Hygrophoropsis aurantiaca]